MIVSPISRLTANNAAYNWMNASNALMGLINFQGNPRTLMAAEQALNSSMLQSSLLYKTSLLQEESLKKLEDQNIKRTFSTFA